MGSGVTDVDKIQKLLSTKFDILGNLPREISNKILFPLTPDDIVNAFKCCQKWQQNMDYEFLWKEIFRRTYNDVEKEPDTEIYKNMLRSHSSQWLGRYMYSYALDHNLNNNIYKEVFLGLNSKLAYDFIHFDDRNLILGLWGASIIIINSSTGTTEKEIPLTFYSNPIKHGDLLIAVLDYSDLVIWSIENLNCIDRVSLDSNGIRSVETLQACKHLITITTRHRQSEVFVFNIKTRIFRQLENSYQIYCADETMATAQHDGRIEIVDINFLPIKSIDCSAMGFIFQISLTADFLTTAFERPQSSTYLSVWNIKTNSNFKISIWSLQKNKFHVTAKNILICSQSLNSYEVWNLCSQTRLFKIDIDLPTPRFSFDDRYVFFPGNNKPIWYIKTGNFIPIKLFHKSGRFIASTSSKFVLNYSMQSKEFWQILDFEANMLKTIN